MSKAVEVEKYLQENYVPEKWWEVVGSSGRKQLNIEGSVEGEIIEKKLMPN